MINNALQIGIAGLGSPGVRLDSVAASYEEVARHAGLSTSPRERALTLIHAALLRAWAGDFAEAKSSLASVADLSDSPAGLITYGEAALGAAVRGVVCEMSGEPSQGWFDQAQARAKLSADPAGTLAIVTVLQAEISAYADPLRARRDSLNALAHFRQRGVADWYLWALRAAAVTAREAGLTAVAGAELLAAHSLSRSPWDQARTELALGEMLFQEGRFNAARPYLISARSTFKAQRAKYLAMRALTRLTVADPHSGR
ncbi:hypothetical protein ACFY2W_33995 [Streptomyces sp. NPDC001262]|uniref:hypothetical protein n=1 Tax=Streptomyces sp. NPDC001262 TaxID=3364552 RepID=UPI0036BFBBD4